MGTCTHAQTCTHKMFVLLQKTFTFLSERISGQKDKWAQPRRCEETMVVISQTVPNNPVSSNVVDIHESYCIQSCLITGLQSPLRFWNCVYLEVMKNTRDMLKSACPPACCRPTSKHNTCSLLYEPSLIISEMHRKKKRKEKKVFPTPSA